MSTALVAMNDMERMAAAIAASKLFGMQTQEQALALMIVAQAENRHPGSIAAEYHIIQGRPALKADAMLARFQQAGGVVEWKDYTDSKVSGYFSHSTNAPKPVLIEWTIEQAKKAGLTGKDNWTKYPRQMLRARVISEGVRTVYPAVAVGVYTPEEVQDFEPAADRKQRRNEPRNMGAAEVVTEQAPGGGEPPASPAGSPPEASTPSGAPATISADQHIALTDALREAGIKPERAAKAWGVDKVASLPAASYQRASDWIERARAPK